MSATVAVDGVTMSAFVYVMRVVILTSRSLTPVASGGGIS